MIVRTQSFAAACRRFGCATVAAAIVALQSLAGFAADRAYGVLMRKALQWRE